MYACQHGAAEQHGIIPQCLISSVCSSDEIKQHKNLTDNYFYQQKFPDLH